MSHWVWHNVWQVSSTGWGECEYCLNYDAHTYCLVFLPIGLALLFFGWLFFQKDHFAVGLVLAQLLAIILLGIALFLLSMGVRRCWHRLRARKKYSSSSSSNTTKQCQQQQQQAVQEA